MEANTTGHETMNTESRRTVEASTAVLPLSLESPPVNSSNNLATTMSNNNAAKKQIYPVAKSKMMEKVDNVNIVDSLSRTSTPVSMVSVDFRSPTPMISLTEQPPFNVDNDFWNNALCFGLADLFDQSSAHDVLPDQLTAVNEDAPTQEEPPTEDLVHALAVPLVGSSVKKGVACVGSNSHQSKQFVRNLSNQESVVMEMGIPERGSFPAVVSSAGTEPLNDHTFTRHGEATAIESQVEKSQGFHGMSSPRTPKTQSAAGNKTRIALGSAPKLQTPIAVSPMPSVARIQTQAEINSRRRSKTEAVPPRSNFMVDIAPNNLFDVELGSGTSKAAKEDEDLAALIREEYEDVSNDVLYHHMAHCHEGDKANLPSYQYPGTYEAAKHDTYEAAKNIGSAAMTFTKAFVSSGIGKAAWSAGALSLDVGRRAGKHMTTQAIIKSGYKDSLPTAIQSWADANEEKRRWKAEVKKREYETAGQSQTRSKFGNPFAFIKASSKKDTNTQFTKDLSDERSTGNSTKQFLANNANVLDSIVEDEWNSDRYDLDGFEESTTLSPVHSAAPMSNRTYKSPYLSTMGEATMGYTKASVAKVGDQDTSTNSGVHGQYGNYTVGPQ